MKMGRGKSFKNARFNEASGTLPMAFKLLPAIKRSEVGDVPEVVALATLQEGR